MPSNHDLIKLILCFRCLLKDSRTPPQAHGFNCELDEAKVGEIIYLQGTRRHFAKIINSRRKKEKEEHNRLTSLLSAFEK